MKNSKIFLTFPRHRPFFGWEEGRKDNAGSSCLQREMPPGTGEKAKYYKDRRDALTSSNDSELGRKKKLNFPIN